MGVADGVAAGSSWWAWGWDVLVVFGVLALCREGLDGTAVGMIPVFDPGGRRPSVVQWAPTSHRPASEGQVPERAALGPSTNFWREGPLGRSSSITKQPEDLVSRAGDLRP
jgi:hypothetical protein